MKKIHQIPLIIAIFAIVICISCFNIDVACAADGSIHEANPEPTVALTAQERAWLKAHPEIRLAYPPGHEPTLMADEDGTLIGVLADYFGLINQRLETNISLTLVPWLEVDDKIRNREIEGLVAATSSKVEALGLLPTQRKFSSYVVVYGQGHADSLKFPDDLHGRRVAILSGFNHTDLAVDQIRDKAEIIAVKSPRAGLEAVHQNRADFFIGAISNNYLVSKYQLFGIGALHVFWDQPYRAGPAARSDLPELATILEKGANLITDEEFDALVARWTRVRRTEIQVELTPDERIWLDQHPNIELGYTDVFEPGIIVNEDGSYSGTLVDILELLNQRLGTNFNPTAKSIPELIRQVNDKELAGVLSIHSDRADKLEWLRTKSYMNSYPTIFTRKGFTFTGPSDLAGKKIALIDKVFFSRNLVDLYGAGSKLIKVKDGREGLETVRNGKAELYIGSSRNSYLLSKYQFYDLIASFQFYDHPTPNVMAVRNDWPQLVSILNKGLEAISVEEIESILRKWGSDSEKQQVLNLTTEEQAWLKENPRIGVGVSPIPPYMFTENGRIQGYVVDMMEILASQAGLTADFSMNPIAENLSRVERGELHTILAMIHSEEREGFMYFSENVMNMQMSIFARTSRSDISDATSLADKVIASYKGYGFEPAIKKYLPNARIIRADDTEGMLRLVASGEADAAVQELHSGEYILRDSFINGVIRKGSFAPPGLPMMTGSEFGVSKKFPLLNSILNKSYNALPESEKSQVWKKWFANDIDGVIEKQIKLTSKEKAWLAQNHTVRVFSTDHAPLMSFKGDKPFGISVDFLSEVSKRTGIKFDITKPLRDFPSALKGLIENGGPDLMAALNPTPEREKDILFTKPYVTSPKFIFTRNDAPFISSMASLSGKTVAVIGGYVTHKLLDKNYPDINLLIYNNNEAALRAVSSGKAFAFIGSLLATSSMINEFGLTNIKASAPSALPEATVAMGIRNDWPELRDIINKGFDAIPEREKFAIINKWSSVKIDYGIRPAALIKWVLLVVGGGFGTILFFVIWNRTLATRVRQRTVELERTAESLKSQIVERNQAEAALKSSRRFTDNLIETANVIIVGLDAAGDINLFNPAAERITGYTISELHGKNWFELLSPKERYPQVHQEFSRLMAGGLPKLFQNTILTKNGEERMISWSNNEIKTGDQITGTLSFGLDITEVKQTEKKLQKYQQQLKALASQLTIAEEKERRKIAADLHDQIGQTLALARFQLAAISKSVSEAELTDQINELSDSMRQAARDAQNLIFDLSSPSLNEIGLSAAISEWLEETIAKRYGLKTEFIEKGREKFMDLDERAILFRSVRELLINVIKHARASKVSVAMEYTETFLKITVRDDGVGIDPSLVSETGAAEKGFGMFSIQERMTNFGGNFEIESKPGQGCKTTLTVPLSVASSE